MTGRMPTGSVCARIAVAGVFSCALALTGCAALSVPVETQPTANPFLLPIGTSPQSHERTWERCVDVLHQYRFSIARENRQAGTIETEYKVGAGLLEPWHPDSVNPAARLESTLQSIRRKVIVRIIPDDAGTGYLVGIEAFKEREDLPTGVSKTRGGSTFNEYELDNRDHSRAIDSDSLSGWIPLGRDTALERDLLQSLQLALTQ